MLMFASSLFDGDAHGADQLPIVLAGKAGRHSRQPHLGLPDKGDDNRALRLYLALMDMMGVSWTASATPTGGWRACRLY